MVTKENFLDFKTCYINAVNKNETQFTFNGIEVLTSYAKYVIDYVESSLKKNTPL
jgi:hypothetical protein